MGKPFLCATYSATWVALSSAMASLDLRTSLAANCHAMPRALHKTPWRRRLQLPCGQAKALPTEPKIEPPSLCVYRSCCFGVCGLNASLEANLKALSKCAWIESGTGSGTMACGTNCPPCALIASLRCEVY